ncbi:MAG TPA: hypothetical protein PKG52_07920 [bacterium]|nr:hypothetical protein [bacterium]HPS29972.1 hypothetical protein [bacterium]
MRIIIIISAIFVFSSCQWNKTEEEKLKKRQIVCVFSDADSCREIKCKAAIKTDSEKLHKSIKAILMEMSYLNIKGGFVTWRFPWPFDNISEKAETEETADTIYFKGEKKLKTLSFKSSDFTVYGSILEINAVVCSNIPEFIEENILFNGLKDIYKEIRDELE